MDRGRKAAPETYLDSQLERVAEGETVEVREGNAARAEIVPQEGGAINCTVLGRGVGTVEVSGDLIDPVLGS